MLRLFGHIAPVSANTLSNRGGLTVLVHSFPHSSCGLTLRHAVPVHTAKQAQKALWMTILKHRRVS